MILKMINQKGVKLTMESKKGVCKRCGKETEVDISPTGWSEGLCERCIMNIMGGND